MRIRKFAALAASLGVIAAFGASVPMSAGAEGYTAITGGEVSFDKYLVMDKDATTPNVSFEYNIAPGTAKTATDTTQAIVAGPTGAKFKHVDGDGVTVSGTGNTKATVAFTPADTTVLDENADAQNTIAFGDDTPGNEKFASKAVTVDLSEVSFAEPGIYRYSITETPSTYGGIVNDTILVRYLDVYVVDNDGILEVAAKVFQTDDSQPSYSTAITTSDKKSTGFTNKYGTNDLTLEKVVSGNQSSKNKYFQFTVKLVNPTGDDSIVINDDDVFAVSGTFDKEVSSVTAANKYTASEIQTANNVASVTFSEIAAGKVFYLKGGQNVIISGIPAGLGYEIEEDPEDYKPAITVSGDTKNAAADDIAALASGTDYVSDKLLEADTTVKYTNVREGAIPTGVLISIAGSAAIVAIGLAGIFAGSYYVKKKRSEEEQ